jgi:hypothetical protein
MGFVGLQESCIFGGWIDLEVVSLRLDLLKLGLLGFSRGGLLKFGDVLGVWTVKEILVAKSKIYCCKLSNIWAKIFMEASSM